MGERSALAELIRKARHRSVFNLVLSQAALAASAGVAGLILLLVAGTQILNWPWLVALFLGSFLLGLIRALRRMPRTYAVAQQVDRRLSLHDTLSTALYFREHERKRNSVHDVTGALDRRAEAISQDVDVRRAMPIAPPRSLYAAASLAVAALGLFGLRYGLLRSLDLRPPIVHAAVFDVFRSVPRTKGTPAEKQAKERTPEMLETAGITVDHVPSRDGQAASSSADSGTSEGETAKAAESKLRGENGTPIEEASEEGEAGSGAPQLAKNAASDSGGEGNKPPDGAAPQPSSSNSDNASLMNKLRDAMADLLSRLKMQPQLGDSRQAASNGQSGLPSGQQRRTPGQQGQPGSGRQQADNGSAGEQQTNQEGNGNSQGASRKSERASGDRTSGRERSGMGKEEGDKALREAEQLAAMGKISEILGKRSENVSGEVMVEVSSGKQQELKTPYSQRQAQHKEAGGEIHRDEVPLIFQNYVQQYFEQIRKTPPPAAEQRR